MQHDQHKTMITLLGIPGIAFALAFTVFYVAQLDFVVATAIFEAEGGHWSLAHHWFVSDVLHSGSRFINNILVANLLGFWLYQKCSDKENTERTVALSRLVLSLLLSFAVVALLKRLVPMECPWDLQQFGGDHAFIGLLAERPSTMPRTQCFPAGHASIGYAWVALYFYFLPGSVTKARIGLFTGLLLGLLLGIAQQLRGAHFVSHDLTTLWLCWSVSCLVYWCYPFNSSSVSEAAQEQNYV